MKYLLVFSLFFTFSVLAKSQGFHHALNEDLKKEIKKDDFKYKKKAMRGPASIETVKPVQRVSEEPKIEKIKQIGPKNW